MDKYVTVIKKRARSQDEEKQDKQRSEGRYHPYGKGKPFERQPGDWMEKRRLEKYVSAD